jgi:uncharacterized membrane protein YfcA
MTASRIASALFGAFVGFWIGRALFKWLLDLDTGILVPAVGVLMLAGAVLGVAARIDEERRSKIAPDA